MSERNDDAAAADAPAWRPTDAVITHNLTTRLHHIDAVGIVFFGRLNQFCHDALEELLAAAGCAVGDVIAEGRFGMPLVHTEADYRKPMRLGERITVSARVAHVGHGSISFAFRVHGEGDPADLRAEALFVHAGIDMQTFVKAPLDDRLLTGLERIGLIERAG
jgi:acyl-CoA thioesterase FadM